MPRFSIGKAIGDAFDLAIKRPISVLVWGAATVVPVVASFALILPAMEAMPANGTEAESQAAMMEAMSHMQAQTSLVSLAQYLLMAMLYTAIFRAIIRPQQRSFFSMRLGMDELRVAVAGLAIGIGVWVAVVVVAVLLGLLIYALYASVGPQTAIWTGIGLGLLVVLALLWGLARTSLIAPASVLMRDFAFGPGWNMAKGQTWALVGLMLLSWLIATAIQLVISGAVIFGIITFAGVGGMEMLGDPAAWEANPVAMMSSLLRANWPWVIVGSVVASWIVGLVSVLSIAPFASACKQLAPGSAPPVPAPPVEPSAPAPEQEVQPAPAEAHHETSATDAATHGDHT